MQVRLYDFDVNALRFLPEEEVNIVEVNMQLTEEDLANFSKYFFVVEHAIEEVTKGELKENTYFKFNICGDVVKNFDDEEVWRFFTLIGDRLVYKLCTTVPRFEEQRLRVENDFVALNYLALKKIMNYKSKINCFNFEVRVADFEVEMVGG